jgi:D-alanyl-D-alanine carboxypeptidase/D-alanyl-D-alanine-endopeptidase (penicillin-binding protein 4)
VAALRADLDAMLANAPALRGAHYGVYAVDTATGALLYARGGDAEIQPASTFKLVVGSAALDRLGPQFRFRTTLSLARPRSAETPEPSASPPGPANSPVPATAAVPSATPAPPPPPRPWPPSLLLTFGGDPTLSRGDLVSATAALTGVAMRDEAYVDDSAFDLTPYPDGWTWDDFGQDYAPRVSAATLDENVIDVSVAPGSDVGEPAVISFKDGHPFQVSPAWPPADCEHLPLDFVRSRAKTGARGGDDTIDVAPVLRGCAVIVGSIPYGAEAETLGIAMPDPVKTIAAIFDLVLDAHGIGAMSQEHYVTVDSPDAFAPRPNLKALVVDPPLWTHDSQPLGELIGPRFWIPSDNLFGELLLKEIGLVSGGKPGSTEKGIAYEKVWLKTLGVDLSTMTFADACGMSQYDRITPRDLVTILQHDWNGPNRQLVLDSLPVGGARGTIEGIAGTPAAGRVFAKTGSMMHVRGLAGYLATRRHGAVTFAFNVDDWNGDYSALAALRAQVLSRIVADSS